MMIMVRTATPCRGRTVLTASRATVYSFDGKPLPGSAVTTPVSSPRPPRQEGGGFPPNERRASRVRRGSDSGRWPYRRQLSGGRAAAGARRAGCARVAGLPGARRVRCSGPLVHRDMLAAAGVERLPVPVAVAFP
jgi:hypothetical protein